MWCCGAKSFCQGVRRGISRALDVPALLTDSFRNWFFGGTTFLGTPDEKTVSLKLILFFNPRRISSRILNHFLTPEQGLWSSWWAVCSKPCWLRSSIPFPHCHFFSQVLVLCTMEVVETNLPNLLWYLELLSLQIKHKKKSNCLWLQNPLLFSSSAVTSQ